MCPDIALDPLGHHVASCRQGGDVVTRHNHLWDIFANFCHRAHLSVRVEVGYGLAIGTISTLIRGHPRSGIGQGKASSFCHYSHFTPYPSKQPMQLNVESMQPMTPGARSWDGCVSP